MISFVCITETIIKATMRQLSVHLKISPVVDNYAFCIFEERALDEFHSLTG